MNKKKIDLTIGILTIFSYVISIFISIWKESKLIAILATILAFLALLIYFFVSWRKEKRRREISEKKTKALKKFLKEKDDEIQRVKSNTCCRECKIVYSHLFYKNSISLSKNFDEYFSPDFWANNGEGTVYYLEKDEYIFVDFSEKEECYLIDLNSGLIYLPLDDKWKGSRGDELLSYRQLCSKRTNHFGFDQIGQLI